MTPEADTLFVLYVNRDKETPHAFAIGSQCCIDCFKQMDPSVITVQDLSILRKNDVPLPDWIDGAPILVDRTANRVLKGSDAIRCLQQAARSHPLTKVSAKPSASLPPPDNDTVEGKGSVTQSELDEYIARRNTLSSNPTSQV